MRWDCEVRFLDVVQKLKKSMNKRQKKRQAIFKKYVTNRNLLIDNTLIKGEIDTYLCPICTKSHKSIDEKDPLTLEDAPPKSLGGKANTLTCKSCNNTCGHKIDFHLTERLRELDSVKFLPNTETRVKVKIEDEVFNGKISIDENGEMSMFYSIKNNHPIKLEEKMIGLRNGHVVDFNFLKTRVIPENLEYALLKSGYLLAFEKFGSSMIFEECFDIVRQQLKNPDERIYPENFWITPPYPEEMEGVYFVCDEGLESLLVLFNLNTGNTVRKFGTFLPCPVNPIEEVLDKLAVKFENDKTFNLKMYPWKQNGTMYLDDIDNIKAMYNWINVRKNAS